MRINTSIPSCVGKFFSSWHRWPFISTAVPRVLISSIQRPRSLAHRYACRQDTALLLTWMSDSRHRPILLLAQCETKQTQLLESVKWHSCFYIFRSRLEGFPRDHITLVTVNSFEPFRSDNCFQLPSPNSTLNEVAIATQGEWGGGNVWLREKLHNKAINSNGGSSPSAHVRVVLRLSALNVFACLFACLFECMRISASCLEHFAVTSSYAQDSAT